MNPLEAANQNVAEWLKILQETQDELQTTEKTLQDLRMRGLALEALNQSNTPRVIVGDNGSGDCGLRLFELVREHNAVVGLPITVAIPKEAGEIDKNDPKKIVLKRGDSAEIFVNGIAKCVECLTPMVEATYKANAFEKIANFALAILFGTAWVPTRKKNPTDFEKDAIVLFDKNTQKHANMPFYQFSQIQESHFDEVSVQSALAHRDMGPDSLIQDFSPETTIQFSGGQGSAQSGSVLPKQSVEQGALEMEKQLKAGEDGLKVKNNFKEVIKKDLNKDPQALKGKDKIAFQGLFAIALSDDEIMKSLNIPKEEIKNWKSGQIPRFFHDIITALKTKFETNEKEINAGCEIALQNPKVIDLIYGKHETKDDYKGTGERNKALDIKMLKAYVKPLAMAAAKKECKTEKETKEKDEAQAKINTLFPALGEAMKKQSTPCMALLAACEALVEQYGDTLKKAINLKEDMPQFFKYSNGYQVHLKEDAKPNGSHGVAVEFLTTLPKQIVANNQAIAQLEDALNKENGLRWQVKTLARYYRNALDEVEAVKGKLGTTSA